MSRLVGCAIVLASLVLSTAARASEDKPSVEPKPSERRAFVVANTFGLPLGRLAIDAGTMIVPHVAPVASLHLQATPSFGKGEGSALMGYGVELGVRLYGGSRGPSGPFLGGYVLAGRYAESDKLFGKSDVDIISYGAAFDTGWSFVLNNGLVIAIGVGMTQRSAQRQRDDDPARVPDDMPRSRGFVDAFTKGLGPRLLAQVGYAF